MQQPFRLDPKQGPEHYKTYAIIAPPSTHFRKASCSEVECEGFKHGWRTIVPTDSPQAQYIRARSGRSFTEMPQPNGLAQFTFAPGQMCFKASEHKISLEREPLYVVREGDYRGNPRGIGPVQRRPVDWVDDFATHQQAVADAIEKG